MFAIPLPVLSTDVFVVLTFFFNVLCTNFQNLVILVSVQTLSTFLGSVYACTGGTRTSSSSTSSSTSTRSK